MRVLLSGGAGFIGSHVAKALLIALAYSERYAKERGPRHKKLTEWAWQLLLLARRWHPNRK
jgi:nucleoside-diphosphate-sugar epimerase